MAKGAGGMTGWLKELVVGLFILAVLLPVGLSLFLDINITEIVSPGTNTEYATIVTAWPYIGVAVVAGIAIFYIFRAFRG